VYLLAAAAACWFAEDPEMLLGLAFWLMSAEDLN
jgi:hypothetical protein